MLALALHLGAAIETYDQPNSPVQLEIGRTISQFSGVQLEDIAVGVDGCGVPVFGVTVKAMALMYAINSAFGFSCFFSDPGNTPPLPHNLPLVPPTCY